MAYRKTRRLSQLKRDQRHRVPSVIKRPGYRKGRSKVHLREGAR